MNQSYIAYRFPNEEQVHFVKGTLSAKSSIEDMDPEGIVFCSFDRTAIFQMSKTETCDKKEFSCKHFSTLQRSTTEEEYAENFHLFQEQIATGRFEKIVLSRVKKVRYEKDPLTLFEELNKSYLNTFNYLVCSPELGCWMGVTPELLCHIEKDMVKTVALAGTKIPSEDWTKKEIEEQLYVTNFIEKKMLDISCFNLEKDGPKSITAGPVEHLKTVITCHLTDENNWRDAIDVLHPTPATCGTPAKSSRQFILHAEKHSRKFYTGFVGVFDPAVKRCYVNIRCMELSEEKALIYTGGGITSGSVLKKEWQETERKAKTLENILLTKER